MTTGKKQKNGSKPLWMIPLMLIILIIASVGGYYGYSAYDRSRTEQARIRKSNIQASIAESLEQDQLAAMRQVLDRDGFYDGIYIDGVSVAGRTYQEVQAELQKQDAAWRTSFGVILKLDSQTWPLAAADCGLSSDWQAILDQAWNIGRTSTKTKTADQIRDRFAAVQDLAQKPVRLQVSRQYDEALVRSRIAAITGSLVIAAKGARATGFDPATKQFTLAERTPGRAIDEAACADAALKLLAAGRYGETVGIEAKATLAGMDAATMKSRLGYVSKGVTYANKVNPPRDNNITLICQKLNGLLIQPGETFSFNGYIGERTAAKGYQEAGGIRDGILIAELGGGICQPNTTLCHAVLKADLEIVERHPHSWPSDYVPVGLDATVTWGGADFKFKNNTDYPLAIVASYKKPTILIQIYGRLLEDGVTIELESEHNGYIQEPAPKETYNPALKAGERVEIRAPHTGQRATAFKVWKKNGTAVRREVAFTSYYRPIQGLYEYGPAKPTAAPTKAPTATPTLTPTVTPAITPVITPAITPSVTPPVSPAPTPAAS